MICARFYMCKNISCVCERDAKNLLLQIQASAEISNMIFPHDLHKKASG